MNPMILLIVFMFFAFSTIDAMKDKDEIEYLRNQLVVTEAKLFHCQGGTQDVKSLSSNTYR